MPRAGRRSWGQGARPTSGFGTGWCPAGIRGPGRWDSLACYCQSPLLGPTPHQNPHFVWIRAHTAPATARGSRRRAAAWRTRTRHPNLKLTPFCRPAPAPLPWVARPPRSVRRMAWPGHVPPAGSSSSSSSGFGLDCSPDGTRPCRHFSLDTARATPSHTPACLRKRFSSRVTDKTAAPAQRAKVLSRHL